MKITLCSGMINTEKILNSLWQIKEEPFNKVESWSRFSRSMLNAASLLCHKNEITLYLGRGISSKIAALKVHGRKPWCASSRLTSTLIYWYDILRHYFIYIYLYITDKPSKCYCSLLPFSALLWNHIRD